MIDVTENIGNRKRVPITVRIPEDILDRVDGDLLDGELPTSRNHWIVEAILEKLNGNRNGNV
ncbi:hypothetical protein GRI39_06195 [Altererythrobacter indicus]|uniref:Ribbon-helix-helix protein, CopG family n=1 Tax=Altericroceibacterium indicum TaxID=374177 RepID=A0A845A9E3_9SPHN|nr:hypothetical protein [Altericroceibacterium indicum]MXP25631.1 hypothetical protein [Altericroceibacterium indicum]